MYVRSLSPAGNPRQQELVDRLDGLAADGVIDECAVHVVGDEVCPETATATDSGRFICERIDQFRDWADRNDVSLESCFEHTTVRSRITGEEYETIRVPTLALAEFDDSGDLQFVAPCDDGETRYTPASRLDQLAAQSLTTPGAP